MSALGSAIEAVKDALSLADDVKRVGEALKEVARELRDHDRRLTRLEAKWEAALEPSAARGGGMRRIEGG